jgi:hypothetical protein
MKDGKSASRSGDYACCLRRAFTNSGGKPDVLDLPDAAFDIHYVDETGNEIQPDQALKPAAKKAMPPKPSSK